jgi:hypothetical protein
VLAVTRLAHDDVACWVLKSALPPEAIGTGWAPGEARVVDRCVRASYRLGLMRPRDPCLLWVSGRDRPGVHAVGRLTDVPREGPAGPDVPVRFVRLEEHVARAELLADPAFAGAEVVRMPAGSNPSWLSAAQFAVVRARWAQSPPGTMVEWLATGSGGERSAGS